MKDDERFERGLQILREAKDMVYEMYGQDPNVPPTAEMQQAFDGVVVLLQKRYHLYEAVRSRTILTSPILTSVDGLAPSLNLLRLLQRFLSQTRIVEIDFIIADLKKDHRAMREAGHSSKVIRRALLLHAIRIALVEVWDTIISAARKFNSMSKFLKRTGKS